MTGEFKTETTYVIIKGRFKAIGTSSYGIFIIFVDNNTKNVDKIDIISSHFSTIYENPVSMPWSELEDLITKMKWKGEFATSLTNDVQSTLEDIFQPGTGRGIDIWTSVKKGQLNKVCNIFEEYLSRPTGDKNVKVEVAIETVTRSEIDEVKRAREQKGELESANLTSNLTPTEVQKNQELGIEESAIVLDVSLVLSPISGIPIYDLKEGTKILVKISEQSSRGQYFIDLFNASVNNEILPIPATVVKVTHDGKIYTVLVNIGPGIYGKSMDEDTVKVKLYDPTTDKKKIANVKEPPPQKEQMPTSQTNITTQEQKKDEGMFISKNLIFIIIGVVVFILLIILLYLFMPL